MNVYKKNDEELLLKIQHFFLVDDRIKKEMIAICPPNDNVPLNEEEIIKYIDNTLDSLDYIFSELKCITRDLLGMENQLYMKVENLEQATTDEFLKCGTDIKKIRKVYQCCVSDMDPKFIDAVKNSFIGYTLFSDINTPNNMVTSINEYLHMVHSYVLNNDNLLQAIPLVNKKENIDNDSISLRGKSGEKFNNLFNQFPIDLDVGQTDMVVVNPKKMIMMVRDRGHALTIEITINNSVSRIEYFIPKLCNVEMINKLPGINKVNNQSIGATGTFEVPNEMLNNAIFDFISKVPTDLDVNINNMMSRNI